MEIFAPVVVLIATALVGLVVTGFWRARSRAEEARDRHIAALAALELRMAVVETKGNAVWAGVQAKIIEDLTHPHPQFEEMDGLLKKLDVPTTLTLPEKDRLLDLLEERIVSKDPAVSEDELASARLLRGVMEKVVIETAQAETAQEE